MAYTNGTATDYQNLLEIIRTYVEVDLPVLERWVVIEEVTTGIERYTIWKAPGLDGTKEIFMGIRTYESISSDYYNYEVAGFTGYTPGNSWETQPGFVSRGCPLWNGAIPYWIVANGQRLIVVANIESNYVSFHLGFFLPYATPGQYPYPLLIGGCLGSGQVTTRYSNTSYNNWWKGYSWYTTSFGFDSSYIRLPGAYTTRPEVLSYYYVSSTTREIRNTVHDSDIQVGYYGLTALTLMSTNSTYLYGDIDGLFHISGFNNVAENTIVVDGITYIVFRDVYRAEFDDYMALRAT